jgi:hypothetical protein
MQKQKLIDFIVQFMEARIYGLYNLFCISFCGLFYYKLIDIYATFYHKTNKNEHFQLSSGVRCTSMEWTLYLYYLVTLVYLGQKSMIKINYLNERNLG